MITAVLEDIAAKKALVVKAGQQIALAKAANPSVEFSGITTLPAAAIEPRVGGFDVV